MQFDKEFPEVHPSAEHHAAKPSMILSWYRTQIKEYDVVSATRLLCRVVWRRAIVVVSNKALPATRECPCCGWNGNRFLDYIEMGYTNPNAACPQCDSHPRHRGLFLWLRDEYRVNEKEGIALVFAPERALAPLWQNAAKLRVYKVDLEPTRRVDVLADVMRLPFASEVAHLVWCHHVLEQVVDDGDAMKELHRVLRSTSGELIISVHIGAPGPTVEFGYARKDLTGNRRVFGTDFVDRLAAAGFKVTPLVYNLTPAEYRKYGIDKEDFYCCTRR